MRKYLAMLLLLPAFAVAQTKLEYAIPNFSSDESAGVLSGSFSFKPPVFRNDRLSVLIGLSAAFAEGESKLGNPAIGLKYSGLPLNISASGLLYIPSATENIATFAAFASLQDTHFGYYAPESTPVELGLSSWANLPMGLRGDFNFSYLLLFVNDKQVLTDDSFELFIPYAARVSKQADQFEFGAAWSGIWYATESEESSVMSQLRFDAGLWFWRFKPTVEAAFPLSSEFEQVLDKTFVFKLVVR